MDFSFFPILAESILGRGRIIQIYLFIDNIVKHVGNTIETNLERNILSFMPQKTITRMLNRTLKALKNQHWTLVFKKLTRHKCNNVLQSFICGEAAAIKASDYKQMVSASLEFIMGNTTVLQEWMHEMV